MQLEVSPQRANVTKKKLTWPIPSSSYSE